MAAQFTFTNSPAPYSELQWIHRANASFPVPPSPHRSIGTLVRQILTARAWISAIAGECPKRTWSGSTGPGLSRVVSLLKFSPGMLTRMDLGAHHQPKTLAPWNCENHL